eukprot:TRINITY_DN53817_c0_g1_i1.p1 TRINITY_DN53817_c0_g1~~TRINITY_DN53817_c0_g1_i1.p1  ORF type:complete len:538 (+),score=54.52 TRINITY_DN53817_c0_g1_i1:37-1614(+)
MVRSNGCSVSCTLVTTAYVVAIICINIITFDIDELAMLPKRVERATSWAIQPMWEKSPCHVLAAGVANRGACPSEKYPPFTGLDIDAYSECPGYYFCAYEDDDCECRGNVLFAPGLYSDYQAPDMDRSTEMKGSTGTLKCSVDSFDIDPAVGLSKACYCLPQVLSDTVAKDGPLDARSCLQEADDNYWRAATSPTATMAMASITADNGGATDLDADVLDQGHAGEATFVNMSSPYLLELPDGYDSRRRGGGCRTVLLPWALVEMGGADIFGTHQPKRLRCAYEFGAAAISRESSLQKANEQFLRYSGLIGTDANCFTMNDCTVGMLPPEELKVRVKDNGMYLMKECSIASGIATLVMAVGAFLASTCEIKGFTPIDGAVYSFVCGISLVISTLMKAISNWSVSGSPTAALIACVLGLLIMALIFVGIPHLIVSKLHPAANDPVALSRQQSGGSRVLLSRMLSIRTAVAGPRAPCRGDRVELVGAEQGFEAGTAGYAADVDEQMLTFLTDDGDVLRLLVSQVRVLS